MVLAMLTALPFRDQCALLVRLIRKYNSSIDAITIINISDTIAQICGFGAFRLVTVIDLIGMMFQKNLD